MKLRPRNRRLLLHKVGTETDEKEQKNALDGFVMPENVDTNKRGSQIYKVVDISPDVTQEVSVGDFITVEESMVTNRKIGDHTFYLIQENYVEGILESIDD